MTVIAANAAPDRVFMGCDTRADYGGTGIFMDRGKIDWLTASNGDRILIASSGSASIQPILIRSLILPAVPDDPSRTAEADRWADKVAAEVTEVLAEAKPSATVTTDDGASHINGTVALAWQHHLWWIHTHAATRPHDGVLALGSGTDVAFGSLHTSVELGADPEVAVALAVRLACRHGEGCGIDDRGPIIHSTVDG